MDALERRHLLNFLWFGLDFERSREEFITINHRAFRQWVRQAPEHARDSIREARRVAPDGLLAFCTALRPHYPIYGHFLEAAEQHGLIDV